MARVAATFANHGNCPFTQRLVATRRNVLSTLQIMFSCGLYDFSGRWACTVGVPSKSGISGCLWSVVPNLCGVAVYSPPVDSMGNSVRALEVMKRLTKRFELSIFDQLCADRPRYRILPA